MPEVLQGTLEQPLTAMDRCDRCQGQAYVRVMIHGTELLFCAHHAREHSPKLREQGARFHDETQKLTSGQGVQPV